MKLQAHHLALRKQLIVAGLVALGALAAFLVWRELGATGSGVGIFTGDGRLAATVRTGCAAWDFSEVPPHRT